MSEILIPTWIVPEEENHEWMDEGSSVFRAAFAPGLSQRQSYGGLRLKLSRRHTVRLEEKAQLLAALKSTRGSYNTLRSRVHFANRGSGIGSNLLSNPTFANGTTGITAGNEYSLSVQDRILRMTRSAVTAAQDAMYYSGATTVVQYAPYAVRAMINAGRGSFSNVGPQLGSSAAGNEFGLTSSSPGSLQTLVAVPSATSAYFGIAELATSGLMAGDYFTTQYTALIRCALVDVGANGLVRSDEFDNASWSKTASSISADSTTAPDGTSTADSLVEDSTNAAHFVAQNNVSVGSAAADMCFAVALKANTRTWAQIQLFEQTGSTTAAIWINLSNGQVGTTTTGANWANVRSYTSSLGDGWYYVALIARKTNAATLINPAILITTGDGVSSYLGDGSSSIYMWRATFKESGVPIRLAQTTSGGTTGTEPTGTAMYLKGLTVSTDGILLPGDWFEINGELKQCISALNSDGAGLGYLQFEPALVRAPASNDPVIDADQMGKFLVSNIQVDNDFGTQARVSYDLEHIYE